MERSRPRLLAAVADSGANAFVADTGPVIYRVSRGPDRKRVEACDALFDAVEDGSLGCLVSSASVAEILVEPLRAGAAAASAIDAFLRQPALSIAVVDEDVARLAAELLSGRRLQRVAGALVVATALRLGLPLVTTDRRLVRATGAAGLLVDDYR